MSQPSHATLAQINQTVVACERCPRLARDALAVRREARPAFRDEDYWGRPVPFVGDPRARVLVVGLAPGAHGTNRTGRMFTGDGSGDFLTPALYRAGFASQPTSTHVDDGLRLKDLYIVAVCHCAPPDNRPTPQEIATCRPYLVQHLQRLKYVNVILTLGKIAFDGVLAALAEAGIEIPMPRPAFAHGAEYRVGRYILIASYHPSRQNTQTGRLTEAMFARIIEGVKAAADSCTRR